MKKLQLHNFHKKNGANFKDIRGWEIPSLYSSVESELEAIIENVGLLDRSYLGKIIVHGKDATDLINRISTNDMKHLIMTTACDTIFCSPKGRIIDFTKVVQYEDKLIIISSFISNAHLMEWINRFIILEDVELEDGSDQFIWLTLLGADAKNFVQELSSLPFIDVDETIWLEKGDIKFPALINHNFKVPAYNFCLPQKNALEIMEWIYKNLELFNGRLIGDQAFQIMRIESGMPDWGTELTEDYNPHEARLINAVSFTKGCYTGQEVIARLDTYDKVQKYLMIFELTQPINSGPPFDVFYNDEKVGMMTSYIFNPVKKESSGLGYIRKNLAVADFNIEVDVLINGSKIPARIKTPPVKEV
jgi:folate-binding protein YgfZ